MIGLGRRWGPSIVAPLRLPWAPAIAPSGMTSALRECATEGVTEVADVGCAAFAAQAATVTASAAGPSPLARQRRADVFSDPGARATLDEGCNSNHRGKAWSVNPEDKLKNSASPRNG